MSDLNQIQPYELEVLMRAAELSLIRGLEFITNPSNPLTPSIPTKKVGSVDDINVRYKV